MISTRKTLLLLGDITCVLKYLLKLEPMEQFRQIAIFEAIPNPVLGVSYRTKHFTPCFSQQSPSPYTNLF